MTFNWPICLFQLLGEAEVGDLQVSVSIEQQVLGLQVAVNDGAGVEVVERRHNLGGIKEWGGRRETTSRAKVAEQFTAAHELEEHEEEMVIMLSPQPAQHEHTVHRNMLYTSAIHTSAPWLSAHLHLDDEGMSDESEDGLLTAHVIDLLQADHLCNLHHLQSVEVFSRCMFRQNNFSEASCA